MRFLRRAQTRLAGRSAADGKNRVRLFACERQGSKGMETAWDPRATTASSPGSGPRGNADSVVGHNRRTIERVVDPATIESGALVQHASVQFFTLGRWPRSTTPPVRAILRRVVRCQAVVVELLLSILMNPAGGMNRVGREGGETR